VLDAELTALLESGCALIVGTVGRDREPHAGRAWGLTVLADECGTGRVRLLLDADDEVTVRHVAAGGRVAITGGNVETLKSRQIKGRAVALFDATPDDDARAARYCAAFFAEVARADGTPLELLERMRPRAFAACVVEVGECYDQTPGPGAGARVEAGAS
jgi:hypothetical protein